MTPYIFLKKNPNKSWYILTIIFALLFTWPVTAVSQQRATGQNQLLTLPSEAIRLDSLSSRIARESGFILSFNAGKINPGKKITSLCTKIKLKSLLSYVHKRYHLAHKIIGNHIILYKDNSFGKEIQTTSKSQEDRSPQKKHNIPNKEKSDETALGKETKSLHLTNLPDIGSRISFKTSSLILPEEIEKALIEQRLIPPINSVQSIPYPERKFTKSFINKQSYNEKQKRINGIYFRKDNNRFYASAGLTASEILYVNPQIKIGLPWLFALASWETNYKASGFFYGLGTSLKLSDSWGFQLSASSGALSKSFRFPAFASDTIMRIKTRLTRINLLAEKQIGNRWMLQFGPVLNFMRSNYSLKVSSMANPLPTGTNLSKDHYILRPPYTLSESYNERTASGNKIWIGLQIGVFYRLR